jgi:hypothetical protein
MCTWEEIGQKWHRAQQMSYQAIQAAMDVGDELQQKKIETPHGEWVPNLAHALDLNPASANSQAAKLMRLALHRELIEEHKPDSMRGALALLPKVPTKTGEKQMAVHKEEVNKYEEFAKETAKKQATLLAKKMVRVELDRLQNEAHEAMTQELKAVRRQLKNERTRISELMHEAAEKRQFYEDLVNKRANGYDYRQGLKILRQVAHPDRHENSPELRANAMDAIRHIAKFLDA